MLLRFVFGLAAALCAAGSAHAENSPSTVPMTLTRSDYGGGRIYLPVRFGNMLGTMRLDTGASTTRVALAPWNRDLPPIGQSVSTGASGKSTRCDDVQARNFGLKASQGNDIARATYEVSRCAANDGDDLLGLDFFKGSRFSLDFTHREMVFFGASAADAHPRPFRTLGPDQRLVGVDIRAGDAAVVALFDTGAEISAVDQRFVEAHGNLFSPVKAKSAASEAGGRQFSAKIYKIKSLDLGEGRRLRGIYALAYDFGVLREALGPQTPFILGYNVISRFNWVMDFRAPGESTWNARQR
ncbi:MAG: hypothetical protein CTY15_13505 [Methylocystis sp.]|nr:MAG: hypothetical protein CTY15_13505 [Methylocystis sp.]